MFRERFEMALADLKRRGPAYWPAPEETWVDEDQVNWVEGWIGRQVLTGRINMQLARTLSQTKNYLLWALLDPDTIEHLALQADGRRAREPVRPGDAAYDESWAAEHQRRLKADLKTLAAIGDLVQHRADMGVHLSTCQSLRNSNPANWVPWAVDSATPVRSLCGVCRRRIPRELRAS
jgi:hypothetical protein